MTPDDIRSAIARNPQSRDTRAMLIKQAVEQDLADEIPEDWTVQLYDPENAYDDTEDLIADHYPLKLETADSEQIDLIINAHESGAVSITERASSRPIVKMDITTTDSLIDMVYTAKLYAIGAKGSNAVPPTEQIEPNTGIKIVRTGEGGIDPYTGEPYLGSTDETVMAIPVQDSEPISIYLNYTSLDEILNGLTTMVNAAETYGPQGEYADD